MDKIGAHLQQHCLLYKQHKVTLTVKELAMFLHLQVEANIIIAEPKNPPRIHLHILQHKRDRQDFSQEFQKQLN